MSKATPPAQSSLLWHFSQRFSRRDHCGGEASAGFAAAGAADEPLAADEPGAADVAGAADAGAGLTEESAAAAGCPHSGPAATRVAPAKVRTRFLNLLRAAKRPPRCVYTD